MRPRCVFAYPDYRDHALRHDKRNRNQELMRYRHVALGLNRGRSLVDTMMIIDYNTLNVI
jgi:hypothetical protein